MNSNDMFLFAQKILKKIYLNKIKIVIKENKLEIEENEQIFLITTIDELKEYFRKKISSDNKNLESYLINLFKNRYEMNNNELDILNEIYPNIDVLISVFIALMKYNYTIELFNYTYEQLLEYLINKYIKYLKNKIKTEEKNYQKLMSEFEIIHLNLKEKKEELEHYKIVKINRLYYETYKDTNIAENKKSKEKMKELSNSLARSKERLKLLEKEYKNLVQKEKIDKRSNKRRTNKINKCLKQILIEKEEITNLITGKQKLRHEKQLNHERNKEAFLKYTSFQSLSIETFKKYYNIHKNNNGISLLKQIQNEEKKLIEIDDKIKNCQYICTCNILKFFCKDNLDILKIETSIDSIIVKNIIKILNENIHK